MARLFTFRIEGREYEFDDFTLDEAIEIQNLAGEAMNVEGGISVSMLDPTDARVLKALAYVALKRENPGVSMDDIGKLKYLSVLSGDEEMPPLPPSERDEAPNQNGSETPAVSGARP